MSTTADQGSSWLAFHLYYYGDQDELLVDAVHPLLSHLADVGLVRRAFFLRYWMGGPHVRLRLLIEPSRKDEVEALAREQVEAFMRRRPGAMALDVEAMATVQAELARLEGEVDVEIQTRDCARVEPYRPEWGKYGGRHGVAIAEQLFCASSGVVLDLLPGLSRRVPRRLGTGFVATLVGLRAVGMDMPTMRDFLGRYCRLWSPWVVPDYQNQWRVKVEQERAVLQPRAKAILGGCELPSAVARWEQAVSRAWEQITDARVRVLGEITVAGSDASPHERTQALLSSYLHTHNNRLGLIPASEAYLGYLGHHVLSDLLAMPPTADLDQVVPTGTVYRPSRVE